LNRVFAEADVKILAGNICLSNYVGYSGGGENVISGISGEETIRNSHAMFLDSNAKTGTLEGNPAHDEIMEAARLAKVDFILNVVTNSKREIVKAFAGDLEQAFMEGVKLVDDMYRVEIDRRADVIVVSPGGYPSDVSLFEAWDGVDNALEAVKRGGVIVLVAECPEGHGDEVFYDWMARFGELKIVEREIKRNFSLGGHKAYRLLHALQNHQIILVSSMPDYYASNVFKLKTARATNDALNEAFNIAGKNAKVWTMPYGGFMLPEIKVVEEQNVSVSN
jgi:nickel-dependent lactate racemase